MKVAVVNVNKSRINRNHEYHLFTIKAFIDERSGGQIETEIVNLYMTDDMSTSSNSLKNKDCDVVLFRMLFWNASYIMKFIESYKSQKTLKGIWGHDSFSHPEEYLKKDFDFIIQDEPELSLFEIAALKKENGDLSKAAGIIFKDREKRTFLFGENRVMPDLDMIPSPYLNGMIDVDENTIVYWEVGRGCLFRCDFCVDFSHENNLRHHSFSYLEKELKLFAGKQISEMIIGCPVFNLSHQHFRKLLTLIKQYLPYTLVEMQVRPDLLSREDIEELSDMNVFLNFGLQTINQKVHENLMTSFNVENAVNNIRHMANFPSLFFGIDIIGGLPKMTFDDFLKDLETAFNLWPISINVFRLSMYPGTRMYNRMREFNYNIEHGYPYSASENSQFNKREFEKVSEIAEGIDVLYNKGRMVSVITMLAKGLEMPNWEIIQRWNKWIKKQPVDMNSMNVDDIDYNMLFEYIIEFFNYLFDRFQKKKLWSIASDLLKHNHFYTTSLMTIEEDIITYPYQIESINGKTFVGINSSVFLDKFFYNVEDILETGYIDLKKYSSDVEKETMYGMIYRLDGSVFTKVITDEEGSIFSFIRKKGTVSVDELKKKFKNLDVLELVAIWCDEGVLYINQ
ncbi:MAG TPA: B12-binding domain-containing radical SAM protein [bacterium]|nr:B12-binding domain-containing radical SAM protein [bacterium]HPS29401.1 B12-binding domain-containing radical SAM protein [bacterium]